MTTDGAGHRPAATAPADLGALARAFLRSPLDPVSWRSALAVLLGLAIAIVSMSVVSALFSTGGSLLIVLVGIPLIGLGIEASRVTAQVERWRMAFVDGRPMAAHRYRQFDDRPSRPYGPWVRACAEAVFLDVNRWRDVVYVVLLVPVAFLEAVLVIGLWASAVGLIASPVVVAGLRAVGVALPLQDIPLASTTMLVAAVIVGLVLVPVAASVSRGVMVLHRAVVQGLLGVDPNEVLRQDVERLRGSRSAALELEASELRRIERDLHDGAQQRLVALAVDLAMAEDRIDTDPASARALVAGARAQARQALAELRELVRGTAPAILVDRGLVAALGAVAGACPVPTVVDGRLADGERLPAAVERAAYFVVTESLANVAKHSAATRCDVVVRRDGGTLTVEVRDDGVGGATVTPGGGLAGLRDRVEALDGSLAVASPPGGPTVVHVELPIAPG